MADFSPNDCPDCVDGPVSRRDFVRALGGAALAGGLLPRIATARPMPRVGDAETTVKRFHDTLTPVQKKAICFPFDHELRGKINANWAITPLEIGKDFSKDQQALITEIFQGVTSPEGYDKFLKQMEEDDGGIGSYHVAMFGEPNSGKFEWEMTGRHVTIRADGDSVDGTAFGGPIIYGHAAGENEKGLPGNVFYYQTQKANEVFKALDGKQRDMALVEKAPSEAKVKLQGQSGKFPGIGVGALSTDQKGLVESVIKVILAPYREKDVNEAVEIMKNGGGLDALHMAFYQSDDIGGDKEWDIWRLEGPNFVWHFRGAPHVHAYVNIAKKA